MGLTLHARHAGRYRELATLVARYGGRDLLRSSGLDAALDDGEATPEQRERAEQLTADLERMGPTFVKLGQFLSTRVDLLPSAYTQALCRLQDSLEPFGFEEVERIVSTELGVRISRGFAEFDAVPVAAASLGQVHKAVLRDGRPVVVKVQRPDVREQVVDDLEVLGEIAEFLDAHSETAHRYGLPELLERFRRSVIDELDYRREAANLVRLAEVLDGDDRIVVPRPVADYTTGRVLTMDRIDGRKVTDLSPLGRLELDGAPLADALLRAYLEQVLVAGFFHADPHPGNLLLTDDGRLALIDLGQVGYISESRRTQLVKLLLALGERRGEEVADVMVALGEPLPDADPDELRRAVVSQVERNVDASLDRLDAGTMVLELARQSADAGLRPPPELAMLGKALLDLDQVTATLDPDFQPAEALRRHTVAIMRSSMSTSPAGMMAALLETRDFVENLPGRVNRVMDALGQGEFHLAVDAVDEPELHRQLHRMANRVAMGLVLAALIIGSALFAQADSSSTILGYPSIAFVLFLLAVLGGATLLISIVRADRGLARRSGRRGDRRSTGS